MRAIGLGLVALFGCHGTVLISFPEPNVDPRSVLLIEHGGAPPLIQALDLSNGQFPLLTAHRSRALTILYYPSTLAELDLVAGPVPLVDAMTPGARPLPPTEEVWSSPADEDSDRGFAKVELEESLRGLRIDGPDPAACLASGGCLERGAAGPRCKSTCEVDAPLPPADPMPPAPFRSCGSNGTPHTFRGGEVEACEPPPRAPSCPAGQWQGIFDVACAADGSPCPSGRFPTDLPVGRPVVYVDAAAVAPGDGSEATPYPSLATALSASPNNAVIAIAKGHYVEALTTPTNSRHRLTGACLAETIIEAPANDPGLALRGVVELEHLTLRGPLRALRVLQGRAQLLWVLIEGGVEGGVLVEGSSVLQLARSRVRDLRPAVNADAELIDVESSTITADGLVLEMGTDGYYQGAADGRNALEVSDGYARLNRTVMQGGLRGIRGANAQIRVTASLFQEQLKEGASTSGGRLNLSNVVLRDTGRDGYAGDAMGVDFQYGATGSVEGAYFRNVYNRALHLQSGTATISDVVVDRGPVLQAEWSEGRGRCRADLRRVHAQDPGRYGVYITKGCELAGYDVWIQGLQDASRPGDALWVQEGKVVVQRWHVEDGRGSGIYVLPPSTLDLADWTVVGFRVGIGLYTTGSVLNLARARISGSRAIGLCLAPDGTSTLSDLRIDGTGADGRQDSACPAVSSAGGVALLASAGLKGDMRQFELVDNPGTGLTLFEGEFTATNGVIRGGAIGVRVPATLDLVEKLSGVQIFGNAQDLELVE